jgi:hypothetical protein
MKLDNRKDAMKAAADLVNAPTWKVADALIETHIEGLEQAIDQSREEIVKRRDFMRTQLHQPTSLFEEPT